MDKTCLHGYAGMSQSVQIAKKADFWFVTISEKKSRLAVIFKRKRTAEFSNADFFEGEDKLRISMRIFINNSSNSKLKFQ